MSESLDEQLARLDAQYQDKSAKPAASSSSLPPSRINDDNDLDELIEALGQTQSRSSSQPTSASAGKEELDEKLAQVELTQQQPKPSTSSDNSPVDHLLDAMTQELSSSPEPANPQDIDCFLSQVESEQTQKQQKRKSPADPGLDKVLTDITANFVTRSSQQVSAQPSQTNQHLQQIASLYRPTEVAQALQSLEQEQEEQRLDRKRQQRKQETLKQRAREWLKNLDPHSEEGLWFEEFAYAYASKLDAAMDYLSALGEVS